MDHQDEKQIQYSTTCINSFIKSNPFVTGFRTHLPFKKVTISLISSNRKTPFVPLPLVIVFFFVLLLLLLLFFNVVFQDTNF